MVYRTLPGVLATRWQVSTAPMTPSSPESCWNSAAVEEGSEDHFRKAGAIANIYRQKFKNVLVNFLKTIKLFFQEFCLQLFPQ